MGGGGGVSNLRLRKSVGGLGIQSKFKERIFSVMQKRIELLIRCAAWGYGVFLTVVSLIPMPEVVAVNFNDLFLHFVAYGLLMWCFAQAYETVNPWTLMGACAGWGILIEVAQGFTSFRSFEVWDMAANTVGVFLGWWVNGRHKPLSNYLKK